MKSDSRLLFLCVFMFASDAHMHLILAFYCGTGVAIVAESPFVAGASTSGMAWNDFAFCLS